MRALTVLGLRMIIGSIGRVKSISAVAVMSLYVKATGVSIGITDIKAEGI